MLGPNATDVLTRPPLAADLRSAYGENPSQFGELRLPQASGPHPVVIVIHGGFWRAQWSLDHASHMCAALTADGLATWSLEYRRVGQPGGGWPGTFDDIESGSRHLALLGTEHPLNLQRVVVIGHSAGGHLALWLASRRSELPFSLRGVVSLAGVVDLRRAAELHLGRGATQALLGGEPNAVPERYAAASPVEHLPLGVRQVLVHGTADENVPVQLSEWYCADAIARGDSAELITLPGVGHFEVIDPLTEAWPAVLAAVRSLIYP